MNAEDYWRNDFQQKTTRRKSQSNMTLLRVFQCKPGYCKENGTCLDGSTGVLCSECLPGHAVSGGECKPCGLHGETDVDTSAMRRVFFAVGSVAGIFVWFIFCCRALVPQVQMALVFVIGVCKAKLSAVFSRGEAADERMGTFETVTEFLAFFKENLQSCMPAELGDSAMTLQMFKIVIGFYQIISSFFNFNIKWPDNLAQIFRIAENVNFNFLTLPSIGCIALGVSYKTKLMMFTLAPFCVLILITLPCLMAKLILREKLQESPWKDRYARAKVTMYKNILFFVFLIYPMVSITVLKGLHCRDFGPPPDKWQSSSFKLLVSNVNVACPYSPGGSYDVFMYTLVFVFVYPIGVPLCLYLVLRAYDIPGLAQRKIVRCGLTVMIQTYMSETCPIELKKLARLLHSPGGARAVFRCICNSKQVACIHDLDDGSESAIEPSRRLRGIVFRAMKFFKKDDLSLEQFCEFSNAIARHVDNADAEFFGPEDIDDLTSSQMKCLLQHTFKADREEMEAEDMLESLEDPEPESVKLAESSEEPEPESKIAEPDAANLEAGHAAADEEALPRPSGDATVQRPRNKRLSKKQKMKLQTHNLIKQLEKAALREELRDRVISLYRTGVLALPPMAWDSDDADERTAVEEIGLLFQAYRPEAWKFELYEMLRKLLMTALLVFIYEGEPAQVAAGLVITFMMTMYIQRIQPFSTAQLNHMSVFASVGQIATLFYGLLLMARTGKDPDSLDNRLMSYLIFVIDFAVCLLPFMEMEGLFSLPKRMLLGAGACVLSLTVALGLSKEKGRDDPRKGTSNDAIIEKMFRRFDVDQNGTISRTELRLAMLNLSNDMTLDEVDRIIKDADLDGDGQIDFDEFKMMLSNVSAGGSFAPDSNPAADDDDATDPTTVAATVSEVPGTRRVLARRSEKNFSNQKGPQDSSLRSELVFLKRPKPESRSQTASDEGQGTEVDTFLDSAVQSSRLCRKMEEEEKEERSAARLHKTTTQLKEQPYSFLLPEVIEAAGLSALLGKQEHSRGEDSR